MLTVRACALLFVVIEIVTAMPPPPMPPSDYDEYAPPEGPPGPPPPPEPPVRKSMSYNVHEHFHHFPQRQYPAYGYGGGMQPGYPYGGYYPAGMWPGIGGWSNPMGTGSSWAAGGGLIGNTLSFLVG